MTLTIHTAQLNEYHHIDTRKFLDEGPPRHLDTHVTLTAADGKFSEFWDQVIAKGHRTISDVRTAGELDVPFFQADALLAWCADIKGFTVSGSSAIIVLEV